VRERMLKYLYVIKRSVLKLFHTGSMTQTILPLQKEQHQFFSVDQSIGSLQIPVIDPKHCDLSFNLFHYFDALT
jgi:hypothetical protein